MDNITVSMSRRRLVEEGKIVVSPGRSLVNRGRIVGLFFFRLGVRRG